MSVIQIADEESVNNTVAATAICKQVGATLRKHYPGRNWYVDANMNGKVINILCPDISMQYGYMLHMGRVGHDLEKAVVHAGGTILEMFNLSRDRYARGGEESLQRDVSGQALKAATGL